jgi:hypothetical protein
MELLIQLVRNIWKGSQLLFFMYKKGTFIYISQVEVGPNIWYPSFDNMDLKPELLRGIYTYGWVNKTSWVKKCWRSNWSSWKFFSGRCGGMSLAAVHFFFFFFFFFFVLILRRRGPCPIIDFTCSVYYITGPECHFPASNNNCPLPSERRTLVLAPLRSPARKRRLGTPCFRFLLRSDFWSLSWMFWNCVYLLLLSRILRYKCWAASIGYADVEFVDKVSCSVEICRVLVCRCWVGWKTSGRRDLSDLWGSSDS